MNSLSVSSKLNIAIIAISMASLITASAILFYKIDVIKKEVYANTRYKLSTEIQDQFEAKNDIGITNAISIANDQRIKQALATNDRQLAIDSLKDISVNMRRNTKFQNIKIHLHTKDNKSFLRNWKLDKYGDDLSSFRHAIVAVNDEQEPITTFEPGRAGLLLRAITPILGSDGEHYGSLEFIQGVNSVVKLLANKELGFVLLMDKEVNENIKTGKNFSFSQDVMFKDYIISQKDLNKDFMNDAQNLDMAELFEKSYIVTQNYFFTYYDVVDFDDKHLGIALLGKPLVVVNSTINKAANLIYLALAGMFIMMVVINITMVSAVRKLVTKPLKEFAEGLNSFFLFLQGKQEHTDPIEINTNDEFGKMADAVAENISITATLHEEIQHLNTNLEHEVEIKTQQVTTLLDNAGQGFLSFSCDMVIDESYSKECIKLLGKDLAGKNIANILFAENAKQEFFHNTIVEVCEIDDAMIKESIMSLLPKEIALNKRALKLEYKMLENKHIMLILTNVSAQKKLEKRIKKEQQSFKMIVEIISQSNSFYDTKRDYEIFIANIDQYVDTKKTPLHNINAVYRLIHTFKGAFAQLYMNNIVNFLHDLESNIATMIKQNNQSNEDLLKLLHSSDFETSLNQEINVIRDSLGNDFLNSQNFLKVDFYDIQKLQDTVANIFDKYALECSESKELIKQVSRLSNQKIKTYLVPYVSLCNQLVQSLGKEIYEFEIIGDDHIVVSEKYKPFLKSLIHVFRNSIDHGLEDPEIRLEKGKDEIGTIACSFSLKDEKLEIVISDDGAGINKDKIIAKALEEKIILKEQISSLSDHDIYSLVFSENFSTKEEVTDLSGRGVGMSAVKVEVSALGGNIEINSEDNVGTSFIFSLPYKEGVL